VLCPCCVPQAGLRTGSFKRRIKKHTCESTWVHTRMTLPKIEEEEDVQDRFKSSIN
jgi:hypothetical protein